LTYPAAEGDDVGMDSRGDSAAAPEARAQVAARDFVAAERAQRLAKQSA
jgi:hypothetical protein